MIRLTTCDNSPVWVNPDLITCFYAYGEGVKTGIDFFGSSRDFGPDLVVTESPNVVARIIENDELLRGSN